MSRQPSDRELISKLLACAESEGDEQETDDLLLVYGGRLAALLGQPSVELERTCRLGSEPRAAHIRDLVRAAQRQHEAALVERRRNLALAAASLLASLAQWRDARVDLDARIVLGGNLAADSTKKAIRFDLEDGPTVTILRMKLRDASRALRFPGVRCFVDSSGLNFRWRNDVGRLVLFSQDLERRHADAVLTVVLRRPKIAPAEVQPAPLPRRTPAWVGDVLSDLGFF